MSLSLETRAISKQGVRNWRQLVCVGERWAASLFFFVRVLDGDFVCVHRGPPVVVRFQTAIYQILLDWKQYQYYYETVQVPNQRPTQPQKKKG